MLHFFTYTSMAKAIPSTSGEQELHLLANPHSLHLSGLGLYPPNTADQPAIGWFLFPETTMCTKNVLYATIIRWMSTKIVSIELATQQIP
jgi:hypothetical protein